MGKTLVAYFSAEGTTARVAREVAEATGADLYEIRPAEPYTTADLDWRNKRSRSSQEMNDPACRPELAEGAPDASGYDTVLLGFPIWWYVEPRVVDTFVEAANLAGVRVTPFATSGGSGIAGAEKSLAEKYPDVAWQTGALLNGRDVAAWARTAVA
ncbi:flavodoxin [Olsenella profusa]|uniref:Flavodoxin n=1 Tax=Olsenella profusa TaxID=138595 RepID=A0ABS2EZU5_9ACTN|nr:flavodoxin [Olsenella profusa]MBM6774239.1 flavodoxin [Olsenella profusa]